MKPLSRAFIAGCNGFLGRHLVHHLREHRVSVSGADLVADQTDSDCHMLDLATQEDALRELLAAYYPEVIFHVAGLVGISDPVALHRAHVDTTRTLIRAAYRACPSARVVVLGSAAEYGSRAFRPDPVPQDSDTCPQTPYARSKLEQSELAAQLGRELQIHVIRVRLFNTLGAGQSGALVGGAMVQRLHQALLDGTGFLEVYNPQSVRDFLDVRDVTRLLWLAAQRAVGGIQRPPIHIASGQGTSVESLARQLLAVAGVDVPLRWGTRGEDVPTHCVADVTELRDLIAPEAIQTISIAQSLADMWQWEIARNRR